MGRKLVLHMLKFYKIISKSHNEETERMRQVHFVVICEELRREKDYLFPIKILRIEKKRFFVYNIVSRRKKNFN
jgi:hypothetical protein